MPLFSVIIPTYNRADFLRFTLKSLERQTCSDYEAFIIDDGSTDRTSEVFTEFKGRSGWHFIRFDANRRQAHCRNYAMERAAGEYMTFLDADDLWLPRRLEKFAETARRNREAGFIFSNGYILRDGVLTGKFAEDGRRVPRGKLPPYMAISGKWLPYVTTNVAFKREVLAKTGPFREDMSHLEDMELYVKILRGWEVDFIPDALSVYRIHPLTANPASLTLKWEDGIADTDKALETAAPGSGEKRELKNYIHMEQAGIYLKNMQPSMARKHLLNTSERGLKFYFYLLASFLPAALLAVFRRLYALRRKSLPRSGKDFAETAAWIKDLEN